MQTRKKREGQDQPLPIRLTPTSAAQKRELMKLLTSMGILVSESKVLRKLAAPCFAPKLPHQQQPGVSTIYEPLTSPQLKDMLGCRFFAWAQPLIKRKEAIVRVDELADNTWRLWIWVSLEWLFRRYVEELDQAAREAEKSTRSDKCMEETATLYLNKRELRAARRCAKKMDLKRAQNGHSRMTRLVASDALSDFLARLQALEIFRSQASQAASVLPGERPAEG